MTSYSQQELAESWEFKILRSNTSSFRKPELLKRACEEEARADWQLVEKFDNSRLRFKRPVAAKAQDVGLAFDPYRTYFGISQGALVGMILFFTALAVAVAVLLAMIFK